MIYTEILNHMNSDELRQTIMMMRDIDDADSDRMRAMKNMIESLCLTINAYQYLNTAEVNRCNRQNNFNKWSESIYEKYGEYVPKPVMP